MRLRLSASVLAMAALALPASAGATTVTQHLIDGQQLVAGLEQTAWPQQGTVNKYDANAGVTWGVPGSAAGWSNDTKCARLVRELFRHAYSWATDDWYLDQFKSIAPNTEKLQQYLPTAQHFDEIATVAALQAGDLVTFNKLATDDIDHTAIVVQVTGLAANMAQVAGTVGYAVQVLDSTSKPHGWNINGTNHVDPVAPNHPFWSWADSRRLDGAGITVTEYEGAGTGWMILYANAPGTTGAGKVYGWRWGVNEGELWKVSDGHKVMVARATAEE
jgi:hypothetical protein